MSRINENFDRIGITADPHGNYSQMFYDAKNLGFTENSLTIVLGDTGLNYDNGQGDIAARNQLRTYPGTILCLRGNHDRSVLDPDSKRVFIPVSAFGTTVYYEPSQKNQAGMPLILYLEGIQEFRINDRSFLTIPGAYTTDRRFRINTGLPVFADEQLSYEEMEAAYMRIKNRKADIILSHTCPLRLVYRLYKPYQLHLCDPEALSTEQFLQKIEDTVPFSEWYCGHHHINYDDSRIHLIYRKTILI